MSFWKSPLGRYLMSILIWIDQGGNVIFSPIMTGRVGDPDETISSRLGKMKLRHGGRIPWYHPISKLVDFLLDKIDPNHSIDAIEYDEGEPVDEERN